MGANVESRHSPAFKALSNVMSSSNESIFGTDIPALRPMRALMLVFFALYTPKRLRSIAALMVRLLACIHPPVLVEASALIVSFSSAVTIPASWFHHKRSALI